MNVIVANTEKDKLSNLDIDIIKSINGVYDATELVDMFRNFFFNRIIIDVSSIKNYEDINNYQILANGIEAGKIILFLPEGSLVCTPNFLSKLVSFGIYNFTSNIDGVKYLLNKPNTYDDVKSIESMVNTGATVTNNTVSSVSDTHIIGFKNVTVNAGATSLIYMLKKELDKYYEGKVLAVEIDKHDFQYFNEKNMISVSKDDFLNKIKDNTNNSIILVDLNEYNDDSLCENVIYLLEPSIIKMNRLVKNRREYINKLVNKKVVLNKCMLDDKDISIFTNETNINCFYVIPSINDRVHNDILISLCRKLNLVNSEENTNTSSSVFSIFKK